MVLFAYFWLLAQVADGPRIYKMADGPILIPNLCTEVDLPALGLTCSDTEPCPTYLDIAGVESTGQVLLLAGNLHTQAATLQSLLLISDDGGSTWREAHPRLKASALEGMQFFDFSNGWLAGHTSLALPRDPFILLTTDGGKTWRKSDLFADSRVGVVEDFAFHSAKRGWLLVDNRGSGEGGKYELFETQTGGSGWDLREISSRIPKTAEPGQRPLSTTARVRVDDKKGLLRIDVRNGNAWREVSAFKLQLEDCKPTPP